MCMCVCIYVCVYVVCMYICMYLYMYVCVYVCMYVCVYLYTYECVYVCNESVSLAPERLDGFCLYSVLKTSFAIGRGSGNMNIKKKKGGPTDFPQNQNGDFP
jgi:hypothetical protein